MAPQTRPSPAQPAPRTPQKPPQSELHAEVIEKLNCEYNLDIRIPDATLTPMSVRERARQDPAFRRSDKIINGLRYHCFKRTHMLDNILRCFRNEAKAASQKWIRLIDPDEPSQPPKPPKAASPGEILELQEIFIGLLDKAKPTRRAPDFGHSDSRPLTISSGESAKIKRRPAEDTKKDSLKRVKASPPDGEDVQEVIAGALDHVPSRSRSAKPYLSSARFSRPEERPPRATTAPFGESIYAPTSFATTASTSRASLFSAPNDPGPSTQETIPALTDEENLRRLKPGKEPSSSQSQDLFPISSRHIEAFDISFREHEADTSPRLNTQPPGPRPTPAASSPGQATVYSEFSGIDDPSLYQPVTRLSRSPPVDLESRLDATWPRFPPWLNRAPFAIAWEVTRIALHCGVDLGEIEMSYQPDWYNYPNLRKSLFEHPLLAQKSFPERPNADAWTAALSGFKSPRGQSVVFTASLEQSKNIKSGPIFTLAMQPVALDQGCRLHRKFGSDRFFEILMPSPNCWEEPIKAPEKREQVTRWLSTRLHYLAGRRWRAFYARDAGHKTPPKTVALGPDPKPIFRERVSLFAEQGNNFLASTANPKATLDSSGDVRVKLEVRHMLDWLLQLDDNEDQPFLKLFARIQLGLSKTTPVVVLNHDQIRHRTQDMLSSEGKVMNDGIGVMSRSLARKIKDVLGLSDVPSAIQGRLGPAKGMWIIDVQDDDTGDLWIETWPSQRKWRCDFKDPLHRTLEVRSHAAEPRSARLNIQFLPVLEDRAKDKIAMRKAIADSLIDELNRELEEQKNAMQHTISLRQWVNENSLPRRCRLAHSRVPFLGGLPESTEETINFLLDGGFDPNHQKFLQELVWNQRRTKCENLKKKMNIKIPRSAYLYMVVDFWGILEEDEVHVCFSSKFQTESFSDSMLHGFDVLVARSPAHFVSDVQKVKAVFKPELHALKDVIVFSSKGRVPPADKLSGGDYDGDKAWVCWEPRIVSNFVNAEVPPSPDLSDYLKKDKTTYGELVQQHGKAGAVSDMVTKSIAFSMRPSFLGIATNFKERLCYRMNEVNNQYALYLSTLLGNLVDQAKQGFEFTANDWKRFRRELLDSHKFRDLDEPAYKKESWPGGIPLHIIDYLKFDVAKPTIDKELEKFHRAINSRPDKSRHGLRSLQLSRDDEEEQTAEYWDAGLVKPFQEFEKLAQENPQAKRVLRNLIKDLKALEKQWTTTVGAVKDKDDLPRRMLEVYEQWCAIEPRADGELDPLLQAYLAQTYACDDRTTWALIRASAIFKYYYNRKTAFAWRMAGIQLQLIKAMTTGTRDNVLVSVVSNLYAALKPDAKFISHAVSKMKEDGSEYPGLDSDGDDVGEE
ncbi:RNA-dependent RNA polymerase [Colletotrichum plurivorum]|uniref:RNA-dependent RNA polymerase n=1 Tax=Colletotrichum plurivorum TaxID=2175906 RepID=A0A8H6K2Y7_9PEZI|nr:RNA-dependent RNA polymerase [Colletotrichum plurivorum]